MNFLDLHQRLLEHLRRRIQSGQDTERGLARLAGLSQPHLHNVLKGKRSLSLEMADEILNNLQIGIGDLIQPEDVARQGKGRRTQAAPEDHAGKYSGGGASNRR